MRIIPGLSCLVFAVIATVATSIPADSEIGVHGQLTQSGPQAQADDLLVLAHSFQKYAEDFLGMANARKGDPEFEVLMYLHNGASSVTDHLSADYVIISMYDNVECGTDKVRIRPYISERFDYESKFIDFEVGTVNTALAHTAIPAAAQLGLQMKNDLRSAKQKLDKIVALRVRV